jgi:hypothetical protein
MCDFRCSNWSFFSRLLAISRQAADVLCLGDPRWGKFLPLASTVCTDLGEADQKPLRQGLSSLLPFFDIYSTPFYTGLSACNFTKCQYLGDMSRSFRDLYPCVSSAWFVSQSQYAQESLRVDLSQYRSK